MENKKSNLLLIIITIVFAIILVLSGILIYMYLKTDLFKSNKQLFLKYATQSNNIFDLIEKNESENTYFEKQKKSPYKVEGKFSIQDVKGELPEFLKNMSIDISGNTDLANKYIQRNIKVNYSDSASIEMNVLNNGDFYGIKFKEVVDKYIALENNNLKELAKKLGLDEDTIAKIPEKINYNLNNKNDLFTKEEIESIKTRYFNIINKNLSDEMFSVEKNDSENVYVLKLNKEQCTNILTALLTEFKDDSLILEKFKKLLIDEEKISESEVSEYLAKFQESIKDIIDEFNKEVTEENKNSEELTIKVYVNNKSITKIEANYNGLIFELLKLDDGVTIIAKESNKDNKQEMTIKKNVSVESVEYLIDINNNNNNKMSLEIKYEGLNNLDTVKESFNFSFRKNSIFVYNAEKSFVSGFEKETISSSNDYVFNTAPNGEAISSVINQVFTRVEELNNTKKLNAGIAYNTGSIRDNEPIEYFVPAALPYGGMILMKYSSSSASTLLLSTTMSALNSVYSVLDEISNHRLLDDELSYDNDNSFSNIKQVQINNYIASFDEKTKLLNMSLKTSIISHISSSDEPIDIDKEIEYSIKSEFKEENNKTEGNTATVVNGNGENAQYKYIIMTFSTSSFRKALPKDKTEFSKIDMSKYTWKNINVLDNYSGNNAMLVCVIRANSTNSELIKNLILCDLDTDINTVLANAEFES